MPAKAWTGFRSVLCPIDFSEASRLALRYAAAIADRRKSTLTVVYANDPLLVAAASAALRDRTLARRSAAELQRFVEATLTGGTRRFQLKWRVPVGSADDQILKAAVAAKSDLIVMGTHGLTGVNRLLIGSTTLSVLQRTPVPVLAVPHVAGDFARDLGSWPVDRVVAAIELGGRARDEVDTAARIAESFGCGLLLLHIVDEIDAPSWLQGVLTGHERIRVARAGEELEALEAAAGGRVGVESRVVSGHPADEIAAITALERSGLVITALRDRRGWFGARRGSVSYHVLSHAVAPVLACPPQWRPVRM
jgi:nucleotide-binding universal stress UspA family protein